MMWPHAVLVFAASVLVLGAQTSWAGGIQGSVILQGAPPAPKKLPVTIDQYVCGDVKDAEDLIVSAKNGVRSVVAWLANPPAESASPGARGPIPRAAAGAAPVEVTVTVAHPSLAEHFIRSIALFKDTVEISRVYLHPVFSQPRVRFTVALDEGGVRRVLAEPTHSAAWEASRAIRVEP